MIVLAGMIVTSAHAEKLLVEVIHEDSPGAEQIRLENPFLEITIDPAHGGRISSYSFKNAPKDTEKQWIFGSSAGLFMDHTTQLIWPGEMMNRAYRFGILESTPTRVTVELKATMRGGREVTAEKPGDPNISGIVLSKTYTLHADSPLLEVHYRLTNPTDTLKSPGLWIQNILAPGGFEQARFSFRPSSKGVLEGRWGSKSNHKTGKYDQDGLSFAFDPTDGWSAQLHSPTRQGVVFFMDYNWLKCLYCCLEAMTTEWWYERAMIEPGQHFETRCGAFPFTGLSSVAHASRQMICQLEIARSEQQTITVTNAMVAGPTPPGKLSVLVELLNYRTRKVLASKSFPVSSLSSSPTAQTLSCPNVAEAVDLLARVRVTGADKVKQSYEMFSGGAAILGTETQYYKARPVRNRPFYKPKTIVKAKNDQPNILHLRGLFQVYYRWPEIVKALGGTMTPSSYTISVMGPSISYFPPNYDDLMKYDLIVLNNLPANGFGDEDLEKLHDFAKHGGAIFFIGGPTSFRAGGYAGHRLEEFLPVEVGEAFATGRLEKPVALNPQKPGAGRYQYYQKVGKRKSGAKLLVGTPERPLVISQKYGQGVVAVFIPLAFGALDDSSAGFWEAETYPQWMAEVVRGLLNETETYNGKHAR
ncbi:MAG: hypothetical protein JXA11_04400 [Phycisphaerae bacterium]|nr:hypothetical protein [Phycisphaerae bacterium]